MPVQIAQEHAFAVLLAAVHQHNTLQEARLHTRVELKNEERVLLPYLEKYRVELKEVFYHIGKYTRVELEIEERVLLPYLEICPS